MSTDPAVLAACVAALPHAARSQGLDFGAITQRQADLAAAGYVVPGPLTAEDVAWIKAGSLARMQADVLCGRSLAVEPDPLPQDEMLPCFADAS